VLAWHGAAGMWFTRAAQLLGFRMPWLCAQAPW
jgi:hypothetical protein